MLYVVGTFGVTSAVNVPLNDELDKVPAAATASAELASIRHNYESNWSSWHTWRTAAAVAAALAVIGAAATVGRNKERS